MFGRLDGVPVVSISVTRYGAGSGFLGCYIARPVVRGKGYGIQIWNAGMKRLAGRNVGLDGVPAQQANYRKSGYRLSWNNARHEGVLSATPSAPAGVSFADAREHAVRQARRPTTAASSPKRATASWRPGSPRPSAPRWWR